MQTFAARFSLPMAVAVAAGAVAFTPVVAPPPALSAVAPPVAHSIQMPKFQLTASVIEILELPVLTQYIKNQITDLATFAVGWAKAGDGLGTSLRALPEAIVTVTRQVLDGDLLGALTTIEKGLVTTLTLVGGPLLASRIARNQRTLAVDEALAAAWPIAFVGLGTALFAGFDDFARSVIIAGQNLVDSLLPINIGNVIDALVGGVKLIGQGLAEGAGKITDGVVFFQQTLAEALKAEPSGVPGLAGASALSVTALPKTADTIVTLKTGTETTPVEDDVVQDKGTEVTSTVSGTVSTPTATATATPSATSTPTVKATSSATAPEPTQDVTKTGNKFEPGSKVEDNPGSPGTAGSSTPATDTPSTGTPGTTTTTTTTDTTTSGGTGSVEAKTEPATAAAA
ncbi:MAG: hypothetical protein HYZ39_12825 [Mycolicibacterium cosmeticum]|nr:hypothetical protein [Mycolicibacterium cosmeticum]